METLVGLTEILLGAGCRFRCIWVCLLELVWIHRGRLELGFWSREDVSIERP